MIHTLKLIALMAAFACAGCGDSSKAQVSEMNELHEASMNFDMENVGPFLRRVAAKYDGFGSDDVDAVLADMSTMPVEAEKQWEFSLRGSAEATPLRIRVFMDDINAPDLYFFSSAAIARELQSDLEAFADELGI